MTSRSTRDGGIPGKRWTAVLAVLAACAGSAQAGLVPDGPEFLLHQTTQCHQNRSSVAATGDGGFLALWSDEGNDRNSALDGGIFVRRFDAGGVPLSGERAVATGVAEDPDLARLGDAYVVVWAADGIRVRRVDADGQPLSSAVRADSPAASTPRSPRVAALPDGGFAVAWFAVTGFSDAHVYLRRFDALGTPLGPELRVDGPAATVTHPFSGGNLELEAAPGGGLVVAWLGDPALYARAFDPAGAPIGGEFPLSATDRRVPAGPFGPALATLPSGVLAVWMERPLAGGPWRVAARRIAGGAPLGPVLGVRDFPPDVFPYSPGVASGADGEFIVLWVEPLDHARQVYGHSFAPNGTSAEGPQQLNALGYEFWDYLPRAAYLADGKLVATWTALRPVHGDPVPPTCDSDYDGADGSGDAAFARVFHRAPCGSSTTLCLGDDERFAVSAQWRDPYHPPHNGDGKVVALTTDTGGFWFFDPRNLELGVKVLDGRAVNGHFWVFYAALTTVEVDLTVTDTRTGASRSYDKAPFQLGSAADTSAFPDAVPPLPQAARAWEPAAGPIAAPRASMHAGFDAASAVAPCDPAGGTLCLQEDRFSAAISWRTPGGATGTGTPVALGDESGYFWFFGPGNVELFLKVLDGRALNGRFWVFYAGLTNVEFTLTLRDHETGLERVYHNPAGTLPSAADTSAF